MPEPAFQYGVFLSHNAKDKQAVPVPNVVRPPAERLRADGLKVWFDEWVVKPGDSIPAKIEEGPLHFGFRTPEFGFARLCMAANAFGPDWAQLEAGTCGRGNSPFRDLLNRERCFLPLRPDDAPITAPWRNALATTGSLPCGTTTGKQATRGDSKGRERWKKTGRREFSDEIGQA